MGVCYVLYDDMALPVRSRCLQVYVPQASTDTTGVSAPGVRLL